MLAPTGISAFSSLSTLSLSRNQLSGFCSSKASMDVSWLSVKTLILENNEFTDLNALDDVFRVFPSLTTVSLQGNELSSIGTGILDTASSSNPSPFLSLESLNISRNKINDYSFVDDIPTIFANLTSLRISNNPLYDSPPQDETQPLQSRSSDTSYYLTLARIPSLKTLNYSTITPRDREEGEIYYLSVADKAIDSAVRQTTDGSTLEAQLQKLKRSYRLYETLCVKYDRINHFQQSQISKPIQQVHDPGTLASRLPNVTFYIPYDERSYSRQIPSTVSVYSLKALASRTLNLPALQFRLIYESDELDPVRESISTEDWDEWGNWDVDAPEERGAVHMEEQWIDGVLLQDGTRWKKRETEIVNSMRAWGDVLEMGVMDVRIRVEPFHAQRRQP